MAKQAPAHRGRARRIRDHQQDHQIEALRDQMTRLVGRLHEQMAQMAQLAALVEQQRAEIDALRALQVGEMAADVQPVPPVAEGTASRRVLLKWGGAAAAAAAVAAVASQGQSAHAAALADGGNLVLGQPNTATSQTLLTGTSANAAQPLVLIDNSQGTHHALEGRGGSNWPGLWGTGTGSSSAGVFGESDTGYGMVATSSTGIDLAVIGSGRIWQATQGVAGAPTAGTFATGESIRDANGDLWLCVAGSPNPNPNNDAGTWVRAAHVPNGYSGGGTAVLSKGIRLLDTRGGDSLAKNQGGGPYTPAGSPYHLSVAGVNWQGVTVPGSAVAAIGLVTAVPSPSGGGYIALVPQGTGFSGTASLAYNAGLISGSSFTVGLSGGAMDIIIGGFPVDVVIDLFAVVA